MSYNKPEKEFGEAPKVHKIRAPPETSYFGQDRPD